MDNRLGRRMSKVEGDSSRYARIEVREYEEKVWAHLIWQMEMMLFEDGKGHDPGPEPEESEYNEGLEKAAFRGWHNVRTLSAEEREQEWDELLMKMEELRLEKEAKGLHKPE